MKQLARIFIALITLSTLPAMAETTAASQPADGIIRRGLPPLKKDGTFRIRSDQ